MTLWGFPVTVHGRASTEHLAAFTVESCAGKSERTHRFGRALVVKGGGTFSELTRGLGEDFIGGCDDIGERRG